MRVDGKISQLGGGERNNATTYGPTQQPFLLEGIKKVGEDRQDFDVHGNLRLPFLRLSLACIKLGRACRQSAGGKI